MHSVVGSSPLKRGRDSGFFLRPIVTEAPPKPEDRSDEDLILAMIGDEPWAWKEFQRRYDRLIHRCITKVTRRFTALVGPDGGYSRRGQTGGID